jgi:murein DD-endopeptidase MepM/ murein hydrolase activator NlpD
MASPNRSFLSTLFLLIISLTTVSYGAIEKEPQPLDTVSFNGKQIILYTNNSWQYLQIAMTDSLANEELIEDYAETDSVFNSNWITGQIFTYKKKKSVLKETVKLALIDPFRTFFFPKYGRILRGFSRHHKGQDIKLSKGDPVAVAFDGKVRFAGYNRGGFGNLVVVRHYNGLETYYAHLSKISVKPDEMVKSGATLGLGGSTGRSTTAHLHFEIRYQDKPIDPQKIVDFNTNSLVSEVVNLDNSFFKPERRGKDGKIIVDNSNDSGEKYYKIKNGDTLSKIAKRNHTTVKRLCDLNDIRPTLKLKLGRKLLIN